MVFHHGLTLSRVTKQRVADEINKQTGTHVDPEKIKMIDENVFAVQPVEDTTILCWAKPYGFEIREIYW